MFAQIKNVTNEQDEQIEEIISIHHGSNPPDGDYREIDDSQIDFNSVTQFIEEKPRSEWIIQDNKVIITYDIINKNLSEEKQKVLDQVKQIRNQTIFNGISITINGQTLNIKSDNETISRVDQARLDSKERPTNWIKRWKFASGVWADIDATQIETIRSKIADHVEASFQNEEQLENQINNATSIQDLSNIDINSGWPNG
mgnify:CR=1 FL=1